MTQLEIVTYIVDTYSKYKLESVFAPVADLPAFWTKEEMVHQCLNIELGFYGFEIYGLPDKISVLIDDEGIGKVIDFLKGKGHQPVLTLEYKERVGIFVHFANDNNNGQCLSHLSSRFKRDDRCNETNVRCLSG